MEVGTDDMQVLSAIYCQVKIKIEVNEIKISQLKNKSHKFQLGCTYFNINDLDASLRFHTLDMELEK